MMSKKYPADLLIAGAVSLTAQQPIPPANSFEERVEGAPYQNVFAAPIEAPAAEGAWGEPAIAWHESEYFLIYDNFSVPNGPACLMTSKDGVYWKEEGAILYPDPDHDDGCIECPDLRQFTPDGPFVLSYDAKVKGRNHHVRRFAISDDLRDWEKVPDLEFAADERFYKKSPFYNQYSIVNPERGWFAVLNAAPREFMGLGLAKSTDGLHWQCLPPIRVTGVADQQSGRAGPGCKAVETSGVARLGDRYFITGGNPLAGADIILSSRDITGPFQPTPKNAIHLRGPQIFQRIYDLPGGYLSMPMLWVNRERRYYHVAPFRTLATDGESLWFKWWEGNEKLKVHPLPTTLEASGGPGAPRMLAEIFDFAKGLVLEADIRVNATQRDVNWATGAHATASMVETRDWWPEGHFAPDKAIDGRVTTAWRAPGAQNPVDLVVFTLDLAQSRPIKSLRIDWLTPPANAALLASIDRTDWRSLGELPSGRNGLLENLDAEARFVRIQYPQGKGGTAISEIVLSADPSVRVPSGDGGLFVERKLGTGWAWLVDRNGRIRFGEVFDGGSRFRQLKERDLEIEFPETAGLRLILRHDIVDLYVNDYQVDYYHLQGDPPSGRIGLFSPADAPPQAWRPDPDSAAH